MRFRNWAPLLPTAPILPLLCHGRLRASVRRFHCGFPVPNRFISERNMDFGKVTLMDVTVNIVGLAVTIALAFYLKSIWALVLGAIAKGLVQCAMSFLVFPGPPLRLQLTREYLAIVIERGKWIIGHSILTARRNRLTVWCWAS